MIQIPGLAPNPDDDEDQLGPMQVPQADAPRAPLQLIPDGRAVGGGGGAPDAHAAPPPMQPGIAIMQPPEESHRTGWEKQGEQLTQKLPNEQAAQAFGDLKTAQKAENAATEREDHAKFHGDEAAMQFAEQKALAEERASIQRRLAQVEWEKRREGLMADEARRQQELQENGKVTSYWDNPGAPSRVAAAFLTSLGTAFGHGSAEKELDRQLAEDRQTKLDKFTRSKDFLAMAKGNTEAAHAAYESKVKDIDREQIAQIGLLDKQLAAVTARVKIPQAQAEREKLAAQGQAKQAELQANIQAHYDKSLAGERMSTSGSDTLNKNPGQGQGKGDAQSTARQKAEAEAQTHDTLKRFADLNKDPRVVAEVQRAINEQMKTETGNAGIFKPIVQAGKVTGWIPLDLSGRLKSPKAQEYYQLMAVAGTAMARKMDPVGAINADSLKAGFEHFNFANASPKLLEKTARDFASERAQMAEAALPGYMETRGKPSAPAPAPKTNTNTAPAVKPDMRGAQRDLLESKRMLQSLPKDSPDRARWQRIHDHLIDMYGKRS